MLLSEHGLRTQDLALGAGIDHSTATGLVRGVRVPREATLIAAARWLTDKTEMAITPLLVVELSRERCDLMGVIRAALERLRAS